MGRFTVVLVMVMFSVLAFGQTGARAVPGYCPYGCGPFIPLVTTPSVAFEAVSSSPVGASNATGGLQAGARNATWLSPVVLASQTQGTFKHLSIVL
jgi:hypothetical protein